MNKTNLSPTVSCISWNGLLWMCACFIVFMCSWCFICFFNLTKSIQHYFFKNGLPKKLIFVPLKVSRPVTKICVYSVYMHSLEQRCSFGLRKLRTNRGDGYTTVGHRGRGNLNHKKTLWYYAVLMLAVLRGYSMLLLLITVFYGNNWKRSNLEILRDKCCFYQPKLFSLSWP